MKNYYWERNPNFSVCWAGPGRLDTLLVVKHRLAKKRRFGADHSMSVVVTPVFLKDGTPVGELHRGGGDKVVLFDNNGRRTVVEPALFPPLWTPKNPIPWHDGQFFRTFRDATSAMERAFIEKRGKEMETVNETKAAFKKLCHVFNVPFPGTIRGRIPNDDDFVEFQTGNPGNKRKGEVRIHVPSARNLSPERHAVILLGLWFRKIAENPEGKEIEP